MAKEYKNLTFIDSLSGRQKMAEAIDQLASEGWELKSKETSQQNYSFVNTCCLGCIFLPLALLGKKKNSIAIVMEREIDPNRKEVVETDNKDKTTTDFYHKPWYKTWWGILIIIFIGMQILVATIGSMNRINNRASTQTQADTKQVIQEEQTGIAYKVVEAWNLPDGKGNVIVIDPKYDNDKYLQSLGVQLNEENKDNYFVYTSVFTDEEAAAHRKVSFCAPGIDPKIREYNKYFVALYTKGHGGADYAVWGSRVCGVEAENKVTKFPS